MANAVQKFIQKALGLTPATRQADTTAVEARSVGVFNAQESWARVLGIGTDGSGVPNVTDNTIETLPHVVRAVNIIAGACAKLPITIGKRDRKGIFTPLPDHHINYIINQSPDGQLPPFRFWWNMWANSRLSGGGGAEIQRNINGKPVALRLMRFGCIPYQIWPTDPLRYWDNETGKLYDAEDVIYIPGIMVRSGHTVSTLAQAFRNDFGEQLAQTMLSMTLFKQGVYPAAVYGYQGTKSSNGKSDADFSDDFSRYFGGLDKAGKVLPIAGMDKFYQLKQHSFVDSDMLNMRKWGLNAVALMFGIPADMLGNSEKQSYAYSETSSKNFILYTLDPLLTERDQELAMKLLSSADIRQNVILETRVDETMWMLPKDRAAYWWQKFQMGAITADEIRAYDNEPPVPNGAGAKFYVQAQLIPTDQIEEFWKSKNGQTDGTQPNPAARSIEPIGEKLNGYHVGN